MACTTILVGKAASNDGSTMIARNDDGQFDEKKLIVVKPKDQPRKYKSKISHLEMTLPDDPLSYTASPSINPKDGIWAAMGINSANVAMTATETITSNARVMGADPYVSYEKKKTKNGKDKIGGLGEEDFVTVVLPYIKSAREGVIRLGALLEQYGTYESNGIAFSDRNEAWWLETIGGHHWIAAKVRDEEYVIMPNQFGLDRFDLKDAFGEQKEYMCSKDLKEFVEKYHLNLNQGDEFNPRLIFGSRDDSDHVYNTPRAWFMGRYFNPTTYSWDGESADFTPESDDIPWAMVPEKKITVEDVKYILSSYYQGTPYDPYQKADLPTKGIYRPIGVNRTGVMAVLQLRNDVPEEISGLEWICFGANPFNTVLPIYTNTDKIPDYLSKVTLDVSTSNFYWTSRLIGALADPWFGSVVQLIERYQHAVANEGRRIVNKYDELHIKEKDKALIDKANKELSDMAEKESTDTLGKVLAEASKHMKCGYNRADR